VSSNLLVYSQIQEENERLKEKILEVKSGGGGGGTTWNPSSWAALPMLNQSTLTGDLVVGHTSGYAGCGAVCTWTVPAGATKAQFQIWGAGANGTGAECCGFGLPGANGAYATIVIDVTAGDQYTLCAGCALCCCIHYGGITGYSKFKCIAANALGDPTIANACPSYVTGPGLTNFCAEGGMQWETCRWREAVAMQINNVDDPATVGTNYVCGCYLNYKQGGLPSLDSCYGVLFGGSSNNRGPWICNAQNSITAPMGGPICIPFVKECCSSYYGTTTGITGYYPAMQFTVGSYSQATAWKMQGRFCFAPVHAEKENCGEWEYYAFHHFGNLGSGLSCQTTPGCVNFCAKPGMHGRGGSHGGMVMSASCSGGDRGYGGGVRVSWC